MDKLNDDTFESIANDTVLVYFGSEWCGPCIRQLSILENFKLVKVFKVDIDDCPKLSSRFFIRSVPTVILFKDGKEVKRNVGLCTEIQLELMISENS